MGWVVADSWADRARELAREGWWLADLCGLDRLSLAHSVTSAHPVDGVGAAFLEDDRDGIELPPGRRFEVVVQLVHLERKERRTMHVVAEGDPPTVPSVSEVWPTAAFMEREAFDMFGIHFEGHPGLKRILMPDDWEGYPLRKDYGVGKVPVEFVAQPMLQIDAPGQSPGGREARREVDSLGQPAEREESPPGGEG
jgi:NADH:ubiquinone oxidoreductase subunit C